MKKALIKEKTQRFSISQNAEEVTSSNSCKRHRIPTPFRHDCVVLFCI